MTNRRFLFFLLATIAAVSCSQAENSADAVVIDRKELVSRHDIVLTHTLPVSPTQVGNGHFAFGMDITGLQSFVPFNTLSDWGWHNSPLPEGKKIEDYHPTVIESYGRHIPYLLDDPSEPELTAWLKSNPHRVNLGRLGMTLLKSDGTIAEESDITDACQRVDLWDGIVTSSFILEGEKVEVKTICHPGKDLVAVKVSSSLLKSGRLSFFLEYPGYDGKAFSKFVGSCDNPETHASELVESSARTALLRHQMDNLEYWTRLRWKGARAEACRAEEGCHRYELHPDGSRDVFELTALFSEDKDDDVTLGVGRIASLNALSWRQFWMSGAAVDLSGSADSRWMELERRIVLSQYQMRLNESGILPPQEAGLVNNGWYGRFHWEMIWWHAAHWFLWDRRVYADGYLGKYKDFLQNAVALAASEGRNGAKWPKCTGNIFREWPCDVHSYLCWQQPHPIWFAEAEYRRTPDERTLEKWKDVVLNTADYLADYPFFDGNRYVLGPPVAPVSENTDYEVTLNPGFELSYFRYGLRTALLWAERLGLTEERTAKWKTVLEGLAELPVEGGMYKTAENLENMWTAYNFEHPALTGVYGMLPGDGVDLEIFRPTFYNVLKTWQMDRCWGWDYPMLAMAAARLGDTHAAVDLICSTAHKFSFDAHGLSDVWPFPYFPSNGALLTAVAMMCGGWDGCPDIDAPGFPDGWNVKYEGFQKMQ